ncbi:glycosyltransferase family 2 protein [Patescibacteria group bacterium]|nr:glycosyltransferase family 2 protein [Patescibacteria group bacterium]
MQTIDLSVIILSYNTRELLSQCVNSISPENQKGISFETIVVDNASQDGSQEIVEKEFPRVILVRNKENIGFSGGNNVGIKIAKGNFILFLNSDTKVNKDALRQAVSFMKQNPEVGALSAKTLLPSGKMDPDCHRGFPHAWASLTYFLGLEKLFPKSRIFGQYHEAYLGFETNHEIDAGAGAFMMIKREVIEKVGIWDEEYFFYGEDLDFFYRIKKAGYKVYFYAKPLLVHHKGASSGLRKESKKINRNSKENRVKVAKASVKAMEIFYRKFYKDQYPEWLTFLVLMTIRVKGFFRVTKHYLS